MGATQGPDPWAGVLLSDEEALQIIAVLADVLDGHDVHDAVSAALVATRQPTGRPSRRC